MKICCCWGKGTDFVKKKKKKNLFRGRDRHECRCQTYSWRKNQETSQSRALRADHAVCLGGVEQGMTWSISHPWPFCPKRQHNSYRHTRKRPIKVNWETFYNYRLLVFFKTVNILNNQERQTKCHGNQSHVTTKRNVLSRSSGRSSLVGKTGGIWVPSLV